MNLPAPLPLHRAISALVVGVMMSTAMSATAQVSVAQTIPNNFTVNAADCESDEKNTFRYTLAFDGTLQAAWTIRLYEDLTACPALYAVEPDYIMSDWQKDLVPIPSAVRFLPVDDAAQEKTYKEIFGPDICGGGQGNYIVCLYMTDIQPDLVSATPVLDQNLILVPAFPLNAVVDSSRPDRPRIASAIEGDKKVTLELDPLTDGDDDSVSYAIQYRPCVDLGTSTTGTDAGTLEVEADAGVVDSACDAPGPFILREQQDLAVQQLVNDIEYEFRVAIVDDLDNLSAFSSIVTATPSTGFTPNGLYGGEPNPLSLRPPDTCDPGVAAEEGCSQSATRYPEIKFLGLVLGLGVIVRRRRRKKEAH